MSLNILEFRIQNPEFRMCLSIHSEFWILNSEFQRFLIGALKANSLVKGLAGGG